MHRFFYNRPVSGDVLFILIAPDKKAVKTVQQSDVTAIYGETGELLGYNVFNVSSSLKIKASGIIYAPSDLFCEAVNRLLKQASFSPLPILSYSGFTVYRVKSLEEHPLDEKASIVTLLDNEGKEYSTVSSLKGLTRNALCVAATDGSILKDGTVFRAHISKNIPIDVLIVSALDLKVGDDKEKAFEPVDAKEGDDFFLTDR